MRRQKITWEQLEELLKDNSTLMKEERIEEITLVKPRELLVTVVDTRKGVAESS